MCFTMPSYLLEEWPWGETKQYHISTASTSAICLCLSLFTLSASCLCTLLLFYPKQISLQVRTKQSAFSCRQISFHSCLPPNLTIKRPHTRACKLISCYIKREIKGEECSFFFFRSAFRPSSPRRLPISNFLTSISGRARSRETLVLSSLVRIATASSLSWMSTPLIWQRKRRIKLG